VIHAGTALDANRKVVSAGGRVLAVVALGEDLVEAREKAYDAVELIHLDGSQYRTDIGLKAANGEIVLPGQRNETAAKDLA
jgi:phosphoribosylamine--glycine ligase